MPDVIESIQSNKRPPAVQSTPSEGLTGPLELARSAALDHSKPSTEPSLSPSSYPAHLQLSALRTFAAILMMGASLDLTANGAQLDANHHLSQSTAWKVLTEQVGRHAHELQNEMIEASIWLYGCRVLDLETMPYRDYLQTEEWQHLRSVALAMADYRCQVCDAANSLHVHHRTYERRGNEDPRDLTVLCAACHKVFHDHGRLAR